MKKSVVSHIIVIIVAVFLAGSLGGYLHKKQLELCPSKALMSKAPVGGFHKFASDMEWMLFINYMGGLKSVDKNNVDEVIRRVEKIISYDPNFEKAYQVGVMSLSIESPLQAVKLLGKACDNPQLKNNWKLPFYAGFILTHSSNFNKKLSEQEKLERYQLAVDFYRKAIKRSASPEKYVVNSYLRALAKSKNLKNDKAAMLEVLMDEWKKSDGSREMDVSIIPDISQRLLKAAQEAKKEYPNDQKVQGLTNDIMKQVFKDKHICTACLTTYVAGDKYCSACGEVVVVYGQCPKCKTVLKGRCCHKCGYKTDSGAKAKVVKAKVAKPKAKAGKKTK